MNHQDKDKHKSFADILLESAAPSSKSEEKTPKTLTFWIGWAIGFIAFCVPIHFAYAVLAEKLSLPHVNFFETLLLILGAISLKTILFRS